MDFLSDFGCFAYYFNSLILATGIYKEQFMDSPLVNTALVLLGGGLSLLAFKLLFKTIDLFRGLLRAPPCAPLVGTI